MFGTGERTGCTKISIIIISFLIIDYNYKDNYINWEAIPSDNTSQYPSQGIPNMPILLNNNRTPFYNVQTQFKNAPNAHP